MGRVERVLIGTLLIFCAMLANPSFAAGRADQVRSLLDQQQAWLGESTHAEGWNQFLLTEELREELAKPDQPDRRVIAKVLGRYASGTPGLEHPHFAATRQQLRHWANEHRVPMAIRWAEQLRASSANTDPVTDGHVRNAKYDLRDSTTSLEQMLLMGDRETIAGWKNFLKWEDLDAQLNTSDPDWKQLEGVGAQFFDGHPGLEYPEFVRVRESLRKYLYLGKANGNSQQAISTQIKALADTLDRYNREPTTKHAADVAQLLNWLDQLERVPQLASAIRAAHSKPNIQLRVSESLLSRQFSQDVNEPLAVNEFILGTHVRGNAQTTGRISADIVPSRNVARIDIVFRGNTITRSVGRQKPVTIQSTSSTALEARKPLYLYPTRITADPAVASSQTSTKIHSIEPDRKLGSRLIKKVAWKRAGEQKPKAEQIASSRAAQRLEQQIDEQSAELLTRAQQALRAQLSGPINRRGLIPEEISTKSFDKCLIVTAKQASKSQFSATDAPPNFCPQDEVVAQVHESAVNNTAEKAIAGLTLTDVRIAELTEELTGSIPDELRIGDDKTPWSISFDWQQPFTVEFDNEMLTIAVRGRRFTSGERELNKVMEMSATYSMSATPSGVFLSRQGDINVAFPNQREGKRLTALDRVFSTLMEKKFSELFTQEIAGEGFQLPGRFKQLGRLRLNDLSTQGGWLSLGWQ